MRVVLTLSLLAILISGAYFGFRKAPVYRSLHVKAMEPYAPPPVQRHRDSAWMVAPFYYAIGAFPSRFFGEPVFYQLPYRKGPPKTFVDHVIARLHAPDTLLVIEGPRTPHRPIPAELLKKCFETVWVGDEGGGTNCWKARAGLLGRHIDELRAAGFPNFEAVWFEVNSSNVTETERPRGILVTAKTDARAQSRAVLVTPTGATQALILNRPNNDSNGKEAEIMFLRILGSLRMVSDLNIGRGAVLQMIEQVKLGELQKTDSSEEFLSESARIQGLLVSKITVDPAGAQAYYHLGGTALLTARHAADVRTRKTMIISGPLLDTLNDALVVGRENIKSALEYSRAIDAKAPLTLKLEQYWQEMQKL